MPYSAQEIKAANPKRCWVDGVKNVSDKHHISPVEYGGPEDGLTVPLCPTCHRNIHREAETRFKTQNAEAEKYVNTDNYPDPEAYDRALFLATYVLQSKLRFVASGKEKADTARNMAQISFTKEENLVAHDVKRQLGFRSLERAIKHLINEKWLELKKGKK